MASRTYIPKLIALVRALCIYITRYDTTIRPKLPEAVQPEYEAVRDACNVFLAALALTDYDNTEA